jgi:hypothetical protein
MTKNLEIINHLNKSYTACMVSGVAVVVRKVINSVGHVDFEMMAHGEFIKMMRNKPKIQINIGSEESPKFKWINPAQFWLDHAERREVSGGLTFNPSTTREIVKNKYCTQYNTYQGLTLKPSKQRDNALILPYLNHVHDIICNGDEDLNEYVMNWCAHIFQKPLEKPQVALVLKSGQGTGKGTFVNPIGALLGSHYHHAKQSTDLTGRFNRCLENKMLVFSDEAFAGSKSETDRMKTLITESTNNIERKGIDKITVNCFMRIIMASNRDAVVRIEKDERRYVFLEVSEKNKQCSKYYKPLSDLVVRDDFKQALLRHFLDKDLSNFDPRQRPKNKALDEQKLDALEPMERWFLHYMRTKPVFPENASVSELSSEFEEYLDNKKISFYGDIPRAVGKFCSCLGFNKKRITKAGGNRDWIREIGGLDRAFKAFQNYLGFEFELF